VGAAACVLALGAGLSSVPEAPAAPGLPGEDKLDFGWKFLGYRCETHPNQPLIRAVVKARMLVNNVDKYGRWAKNMTFKVRLIPTTAGINISREWGSKKVSTPLYTASYNHVFEVASPWMKSTADWRMQTKYIWDRPAPVRDVTRTFTTPIPIVCGFTASP
jgi:hypothetical protein